jgi:hypothetical protein
MAAKRAGKTKAAAPKAKAEAKPKGKAEAKPRRQASAVLKPAKESKETKQSKPAQPPEPAPETAAPVGPTPEQVAAWRALSQEERRALREREAARIFSEAAEAPARRSRRRHRGLQPLPVPQRQGGRRL